MVKLLGRGGLFVSHRAYFSLVMALSCWVLDSGNITGDIAGRYQSLYGFCRDSQDAFRKYRVGNLVGTKSLLSGSPHIGCMCSIVGTCTLDEF